MTPWHFDGKTLRGSQGHQLPGVHLLAAYSRDVEAVLAQLAVPGKTNEHKTALQLLKPIPLEGTLVTGDAAFTQRDLCAAWWSKSRGQYFLTVKDNQPTLEANIRAAFSPAFSPSGAATTGHRRRLGLRAEVSGEHGRVDEIRRITTTTRLTEYLDWPVGVKQVCSSGTDAAHPGQAKHRDDLCDHSPWSRGGFGQTFAFDRAR